MKETSIDILILHAIILVIQFALQWMFPRLRLVTPGTYFILLPVGFRFFLDPGPWTTAILVVFGLVYMLLLADRAVGKAGRTAAEGDAAT